MLLRKSIPILFILKGIRWELLIVVTTGITFNLIHASFRSEIPELPISIPAFLGTAISVVLSFKLNQSYDRWWEARKIWGSIVNDSRTLVIQLQMFLPRGNEPEIKKIAYRQIAWCYCLGQSLRGLDPLADLGRMLSEHDLKSISSHDNKPLAILQLNSSHLAELKNEGKLDTFSLVQINQTLVNFSNAMGMAERIKSTVFPVTYRLFLHLFIYVFVITLSIALDEMQPYFEIPLLLVISCSFFLLEKSASQLKDPFSNEPTDTPMTAIARTIEINLQHLIRDGAISKPYPAEGYFQM
jgi:putative membrane protein